MSDLGQDKDLGKIDLRVLPLSPHENPLVEPQEIKTRRRHVKAGRSDRLMSIENGRIEAVSTIYTIEEKDDAEFVKVFATGVAASYELSRTAQRVFQAVLNQYQKTPMSKGYADHVNLLWFNDGLDGEKIGMSEKTFRRGIKELLSKKFIAPKDGVSYWVNPALFFKGDRVMFLKEYKRKRNPRDELLEPTKGGLVKQNDPYTADLLPTNADD